jgi:hypothetical protein
VLAALVTLTASLLLYLTFVSPVHAMGGRYLATTLPFAVFVPALLARGFAKGTATVLLAGACAILLAATLLTSGDMRSSAPAVLEQADRVVLDNPRRGVAPRYLIHIDEGAELFVATQEALLADPNAWTKPLEPGDVYVGHVEYEATAEDRIAIIETLRERLDSEVVLGPLWNRGQYALLAGRPGP